MIPVINQEKNKTIAESANAISIANNELLAARLRGNSKDIRKSMGKLTLEIARVGRERNMMNERFSDLAEEAYAEEQNLESDF